MTLSRSELARIEAEMARLKAAGIPFAMATVVRTVDATSAKPGGKALIDSGGNILQGWIGGGCARSAVSKAACEAIKAGESQFVSLLPQELLDSHGFTAGEERDGIRFARNGCPSKGTMDIFVEPVLPLPELVVFGTGLVALALLELSGRFDFNRTLCAPEGAEINPAIADQIIEGFAFGNHVSNSPYVVIATQGNGDLAALRSAISSDAAYICFVGSRKKFTTLSERLISDDASLKDRLMQIHAPAGLDINAITPEEISLSILAQITQVRRVHKGLNTHLDAYGRDDQSAAVG